MKKLHYLSGLTLTIFIALHLTNHLTSIFGAETHIEVMNQLRPFYRNLIAEAILLFAVAIQIITGLKLFFSKRKITTNRFIRLQIWTGLYLAFFLSIHVSAVLVGRFILELDTNFYFGVAGLNTFPLNLFFIPYYSLAIISFFGHIAGIHFQKMKRSVFGISVEQQSTFILVLGILVTGVTLYGLTNGFAGVEIPEEYNMMIGK